MSPIRSAMVLAAGIGTRMRPLTDTRPKPMVEVGGRALIDHVLNRLAEADIDTAVVNLHHHADLMERHLRQRRGPPDIVFSDERDALLETGGGIRRALPLLGPAPFISINADTIWIEGIRPNLPTLIDGFDPERMDGLLLLAPTSASIGYDGRGDFVMDGQGALTFRGERSVAPFVYAGAAVLRPELFDDSPEGPFSLTYLFRRAAEEGRLFGLRLEGVWMHVGTPEAIAEAEEAILHSVD
ncbi:nucleotidyltransferase family protein [Starkeya sp. ORNL1]|uniref:nucleotidyltransferase family protein n=1 Tax=Starkeya sp. ORNL1 TaxID=2709380 RepID=UPI0014634BF1|nr:nucleotidyltransferase family protein [Starkeya sp. ORNL1]QJP15209.1 nucleotidyltransferase family protein [Starkeya sp. ORNL1]